MGPKRRKSPSTAPPSSPGRRSGRGPGGSRPGSGEGPSPPPRGRGKAPRRPPGKPPEKAHHGQVHPPLPHEEGGVQEGRPLPGEVDVPVPEVPVEGRGALGGKGPLVEGLHLGAEALKPVPGGLEEGEDAPLVEEGGPLPALPPRKGEGAEEAGLGQVAPLPPPVEGRERPGQALPVLGPRLQVGQDQALLPHPVDPGHPHPPLGQGLKPPGLGPEEAGRGVLGRLHHEPPHPPHPGDVPPVEGEGRAFRLKPGLPQQG